MCGKGYCAIDHPIEGGTGSTGFVCNYLNTAAGVDMPDNPAETGCLGHRGGVLQWALVFSGAGHNNYIDNHKKFTIQLARFTDMSS